MHLFSLFFSSSARLRIPQSSRYLLIPKSDLIGAVYRTLLCQNHHISHSSEENKVEFRKLILLVSPLITSRLLPFWFLASCLVARTDFLYLIPYSHSPLTQWARSWELQYHQLPHELFISYSSFKVRAYGEIKSHILPSLLISKIKTHYNHFGCAG